MVANVFLKRGRKAAGAVDVLASAAAEPACDEYGAVGGDARADGGDYVNWPGLASSRAYEQVDVSWTGTAAGAEAEAGAVQRANRGCRRPSCRRYCSLNSTNRSHYSY